MTYQFKSEVTAGDFWKLTMSRTYRSVAGVCNMVFTVAMILFTAKFFRTSGDLMQMLMLFGCAVSGDPADRDLSESQRAGKNDAERCRTFL